MAYTRRDTLLNAVVVDSTSDGIIVGDRERMSLQLIAANITSGNGVFTVEISNDGGTTWVPYKRLITNANKTNAQTDTGVTSITLSQNGSDFLFFPPGDHFEMLRVKVGQTTDGAYSAILHSEISGK